MISVIIPTYNRGQIIEKAINSVLKQTYKELEIIVVDDCSTDDTFKIVQSIDDERVKYFRLAENSGACYARNYGVNNAIGKYIAFQDSDDVWDLSKLEKQLNYLKINEADVVFCSFAKIEGEKTKIIPEKKINESTLHDLLLKTNQIGTQTIFGKRKCFLAEPFDNELERFQDWDLMIRITKYYRVLHLNEILVNVYVQSDSLSRNNEKALKSLERMVVKYSEKEWLDKERAAGFYDSMGHFALLIGQPSKKYYLKAWRLMKKPKFLIMMILADFNMETFAKKLLINNKLWIAFIKFRRRYHN